MKAAVFKATNTPIVIEDRPIPQPKAGEVLIKVHACGVCHSDLALQEGYFPFATFPRVPGHEVAGVVDKVGEGVTWPKVGDHVGMPWLFSACGHCDQCVRGADILCPFAQITGVMQDGGYQEYMIAPALYVAPIPDGLDFADAGPLMCAGLTVFNGMRQAGFKPGQKVAVIGLGGLGHLGVLYAKAMGGRVAVISNSPDKQDEAHELGAEYFVNTQAQKSGDALRAWDGGADIILATAPSSAGSYGCDSRSRARRHPGVAGRRPGKHIGRPTGPDLFPAPRDGLAFRRAQRHARDFEFLRPQQGAAAHHQVPAGRRRQGARPDEHRQAAWPGSAGIRVADRAL